MRDSGLLYHCVGPQGAASSFWMRSQECQIQENDCGDYYSVAGGIVDVKATKKGNSLTWNPDGELFKGVKGRIIRSKNYEHKTGEWNTIEVLCLGGTCVHRVNGHTNMVMTNSRQVVGGKEVPLVKGKLQIQSEGAEVFYRNIQVKSIKEIPADYMK